MASVDAGGPAGSYDVTAVEWGKWREYLAEMGPSWVAGAIAAGPATMASVITAGATFGYTMLWVVVLSAVLGAFAQYLAMRLGLLTEVGIVTAVDRHLGSTWAWVLVIDAVLAVGLAQLIIMRTVADVSAAVTGVSAEIWAITWAVILAAGLAGRGYRFIEVFAKLLVTTVVLAFLLSLAIVPVDLGAAATGFVPRIPAGLNGALLAAGILGGAVHISLITMHSYTMRSRDWTTEDYGLATFDIGSSMLVAFGIYSIAIFLVAASVLHGNVEESISHLSAAQALGPLVGQNAKWLFLLGLWGAAVSTLGGNTIIAPYLLADKLGWETGVSDPRYRSLLAAVALVSGLGVFIGGAFFPLLIFFLAFGLVGTPFALLIVLYLLNSEAVPEPNSRLANAGGVVLIAIASILAGNFVRERVAAGLADPMTVFVTVFGVALGVAMLALIWRFVTESQTGAS